MLQPPKNTKFNKMRKGRSKGNARSSVVAFGDFGMMSTGRSRLDARQIESARRAMVMLKLLRSAVANAENNNGLDTDEMVISTVTVNKGPTLKRWRARAKGRSARILKRSVNIVIVLSEKEESK